MCVYSGRATRMCASVGLTLFKYSRVKEPLTVHDCVKVVSRGAVDLFAFPFPGYLVVVTWLRVLATKAFMLHPSSLSLNVKA